MAKFKVQRKVEVWVEDIYEVEEITSENIDKAINYDIDCEESETLWDTLIDLGPIEVYDENWELLYSNIKDE